MGSGVRALTRAHPSSMRSTSPLITPMAPFSSRSGMVCAPITGTSATCPARRASPIRRSHRSSPMCAAFNGMQVLSSLAGLGRRHRAQLAHGWAYPHWYVRDGLRRYGYHQDAQRVAFKWLRRVARTHAETRDSSSVTTWLIRKVPRPVSTAPRVRLDQRRSGRAGRRGAVRATNRRVYCRRAAVGVELQPAQPERPRLPAIAADRVLGIDRAPWGLRRSVGARTWAWRARVQQEPHAEGQGQYDGSTQERLGQRRGRDLHLGLSDGASRGGIAQAR